MTVDRIFDAGWRHLRSLFRRRDTVMIGPWRRWGVLEANGPIACMDCRKSVDCFRVRARFNGVVGWIYEGRCNCGPGWAGGV